MVMRRLVAAGIPAPQQGGDARGWKRLLEWRTDVTNGLVSEKAQQEYLAFTRRLKTIPAPERVPHVLAAAPIAAAASPQASARALSASAGCARRA